ncbi:Purple acid phosphatase 7 [Castilleja foliolosa]|uniref:acid phosphatase n=1 Tax=Castilleja foliolosa TaxID=1961234 RepID=A0ABD3BSB5_9LAMI
MCGSIWTCRFLIITILCLGLVTCLGANFTKINGYSNKISSDNSIAFLVIGDWGRDGFFNQSLVANQMGYVGKKLGIDFVISTGDNFYDNGLKGVDDPLFLTSFTNIYTAKSLQKPWYTVLGNHDYLGSTEAQLSRALVRLDQRWYCKRNFIVQTGLVDIVFIDTTPFVDKYFENPKKKNFDWKGIMPRDTYISHVLQNLDLALKKSRAAWKIVVGHHAIRSIGYHGDTQELVDQVLPILEANNVDMYINGHNHNLEHLSNKERTQGATLYERRRLKGMEKYNSPATS